jgi:predicted acyltransferase
MRHAGVNSSTVTQVSHWSFPRLSVSIEAAVPRRLVSLDVFRGAAIVAMILVNNPGDPARTFAPLVHSSWHGWTFADTIFPAFLWISGFALALSMQARAAGGQDRPQLLVAALRRAALLFACGLLVEGFPYFDFSHYQYTGVLQKIAVAWFLAYTICLYTERRGRIVALSVLFVAYVCFMYGVHVPECGTGPWSPQCNAARYLNDRELAGHLWAAHMGNDPDGIVGSLAATASVLLGVLAMSWFRSSSASGPRWHKDRLAAVSAVLLATGLAASTWIPVNKILWTPSYTLFMAGLSGGAFLAVYWLVDDLGLRRWVKPLQIFGMNALAAYVLSRLGADLLKKQVHGQSIYRDLLLPWMAAQWASLAFALLNVLAVFVLVWLLYRRRIFLKL